MPYKDRDRVRQYQREWVRQKRVQGSTARLLGLNEEKPPKLYQPGTHYEVGEKVIVKRGKRLFEVEVPSLDADGNIMPW